MEELLRYDNLKSAVRKMLSVGDLPTAPQIRDVIGEYRVASFSLQISNCHI